jgi:hypothetical protein
MTVSAFGVAHAVATDDTQYNRLALCLFCLGVQLHKKGYLPPSARRLRWPEELVIHRVEPDLFIM